MSDLTPPSRAGRRWLAAAGAVALAAGLSGVALAADAGSGRMQAGAGAVIKGCFNSTSGALRVLTPHSRSCGSEQKISWDQKGPAGNGYAFSTTKGTIDKYMGQEADGPVVTKSGTYFVNVTARLNIGAYTSGGAGFCALDLAHGTGPTTYDFGIFSIWNYPAPAADIGNLYPFASGGMIHVTGKQVRFQFVLACFDNGFVSVPVQTATWLVSPVSATTSATASLGHSTLGPAGFRPKPTITPKRRG